MDFFDYCYSKRKELSQFAFVILLIVEIFFLFRPIVSSPVKGSYSGGGESLRLHDQTYEKGAQKGFYYFDDKAPEWFKAKYGLAGIVLDNGDVYGIKSAFSIQNIDTDNTLVSGRAIFIQVVIAVLFFISVYFAFLQRDIPRQNKAKVDDDEWNTDLLKI